MSFCGRLDWLLIDKERRAAFEFTDSTLRSKRLDNAGAAFWVEVARDYPLVLEGPVKVAKINGTKEPVALAFNGVVQRTNSPASRIVYVRSV